MRTAPPVFKNPTLRFCCLRDGVEAVQQPSCHLGSLQQFPGSLQPLRTPHHTTTRNRPLQRRASPLLSRRRNSERATSSPCPGVLQPTRWPLAGMVLRSRGLPRPPRPPSLPTPASAAPRVLLSASRGGLRPPFRLGARPLSSWGDANRAGLQHPCLGPAPQGAYHGERCRRCRRTQHQDLNRPKLPRAQLPPPRPRAAFYRPAAAQAAIGPESLELG